MGKSYIGIVTRRGLEALFPESRDLVRFLNRRWYQRRPVQGICYWAVMHDNAVELVETELSQGDYRSALSTFQTEATELGAILPLSTAESF